LGENLSGLLDFISFSIDTPERFGTRRKADYKKVECNILRFISLPGKPETQVSMVGGKPEDVQRFREIWAGKVDRIRIYEEHSDDGKFGSLVVKRDNRQPCRKVFEDIVVSWDGKVRRCNHDWAGEPLGDASTQSLSEIWNGKRYNSLRRQHQELAITDEACSPCDSWYAGEEQGTGLVFQGKER
jgi:radical SAM protein with 4Fe4S-binding SPASM domain